MINLSQIEQENNLIKLSKAVNFQTNEIKKYLISKDLSKCLLDTAGLISLLKIDLLTPSNYYLLYTEIYDIIQGTIEYYIREETLRGIKIKYIYESVQQSQFLIPRLYLMIITGSIYLELYPKNYREILYDLINMVKCEQKPLRAFWLRFFLFKYTKDKLPIKNGDYINNKDYFFDYFKVSMNFLMENLHYMNHYILRVKKEISIDNEILSEKDRENMILSQQEVIEEISNIKYLTKNYFENKILPKLIEIICDSEDDWYIQKILLESIIKNFKIDLYYESQGIYIILYSISKLMSNKQMDVVTIIINLLNHYIKFIKAQKIINIELKDNVVNKIEKVLHLFLLKYNELQISYNNSGEKEFNKFIDLDTIFMKFVYKLLKKDEKRLKIINHIIDLCHKRIQLYKGQFNYESLTKICLLIEISLKKYTIYELTNLDKLIIYLDYNSRKEIGLNLIQSLTNKSNKNYYLDTSEKVQKLIELILPLMAEIKDDNEENNYNEYMKEEEQKIYLCKLLSSFNSKKPEIMVDIFAKIFKFLISGPKKDIFSTIQSLICYIINFMNKIEIFYEYKKEEIKDKNSNIFNNNDTTYLFDINIENDEVKIKEYYIKLIEDILKQLKECMLIIKKESIVKAFKYYLLIFCQMNKMTDIIEINKKLFTELFQYFFDEALNIWKNINNDEDLTIKYNLFLYLCGYLPFFTKIIDKEKIIDIVELFESQMTNINDKKFQYDIIMNICDIYFFIYKDKEKVRDSLNKSLEIIKNNLDNLENKKLLIKLMNKILYYIEKEDIYALIEILNFIINEIKDKAIFKEEKTNDDLNEIYNYYKNTLNLINQRKNENKNKIYDSLVI